MDFLGFGYNMLTNVFNYVVYLIVVILTNNNKLVKMTTTDRKEIDMKIEHSLFEETLSAKGITKKTFAHYAKIPYYTVAGWKKSAKVPAYAIVLLKSMPTPKTVTAKQLIDAGMPRAIFWNNELSKAVPNDIFIVSTLKRAYNDFVVQKFIEFFGEDTVLAALMKHRDKLSDKLIHRVMIHINTSIHA